MVVWACLCVGGASENFFIEDALYKFTFWLIDFLIQVMWHRHTDIYRSCDTDTHTHRHIQVMWHRHTDIQTHTGHLTQTHRHTDRYRSCDTDTHTVVCVSVSHDLYMCMCHIQVMWHKHTDTYRSCDTNTQTHRHIHIHIQSTGCKCTLSRR